MRLMKMTSVQAMWMLLMRSNHVVVVGVRRSSEYYAAGMLPIYKKYLQAHPTQNPNVMPRYYPFQDVSQYCGKADPLLLDARLTIFAGGDVGWTESRKVCRFSFQFFHLKDCMGAARVVDAPDFSTEKLTSNQHHQIFCKGY